MMFRNLVSSVVLVLPFIVGSSFGQSIPYTVQATFLKQATPVQSVKGSTTTVTIGAPKPVSFRTKDLINQMAQSFPTIHTNNAILLLGLDRGLFTFKVKNSDNSETDVSSVLKFSTGTNYLYSSLKSTTNSSTSANSFSYSLTAVWGVTYDDTATNTTNGLKFSYTGLANLAASSASSKPKVSWKYSQKGAVGEASARGTSPESYVITSAKVKAFGNGPRQ